MTLKSAKPTPLQISSDVTEWRKSYKFLPKWLRDFHDQKDLFKTIHESVDVKKNEYLVDLAWTAGMMYVIDVFLWFMARHGYTLQKSRQSLNFNDLNETLEFYDKRRSDQFSKMLNSHIEEMKNEKE